MFHGVDVDDMERMTGDPDIRKNFLDHNIKKLLKSEWGIECCVPFKHVFRSYNAMLRWRPQWQMFSWSDIEVNKQSVKLLTLSCFTQAK